MIPDFQSIMLPFLEKIKDGNEYSTTEILEILGKEFNLSTEEMDENLPSGNQKVFYNRVFWAKAHLKMAGLVENIRRGYFKITIDGQNLLSSNPKNISIKKLKEFSVYLENSGKTKENSKNNVLENEDENTETPEEILEKNYIVIRKNLTDDLLDKLKKLDPYFFEKVILILLQKMGYGDFIETKKSADGGIDGIINEDKLGLDKIYIQAKRFNENKVREKDIRNFIGAMSGDTNKGVFVTTSLFDKLAIQKAKDAHHKIILIDGYKLVELMHDYNVGIQLKSTYEIKQIDNDFFENQY